MRASLCLLLLSCLPFLCCGDSPTVRDASSTSTLGERAKTPPSSQANAARVTEVGTDLRSGQRCSSNFGRADFLDAFGKWPRQINLRKRVPLISLAGSSECTRVSVLKLNADKCSDCMTVPDSDSTGRTLLSMSSSDEEAVVRTLRIRRTGAHGKIRGACLEFSAPASKGEQSARPWHRDVDGDGHEELIVWARFGRDREEKDDDCKPVIPLVYKVGYRTLTRSRILSAQLYEQEAEGLRNLRDEEFKDLRRHQLAVASALLREAERMRSPAPKLPAISADGTRVALLNTASKDQTSAAWVIIQSIADGTMKHYVFTDPTDANRQNPVLDDALIAGDFRTLKAHALEEGAREALIGPLQVNFQGTDLAKADIRCNGGLVSVELERNRSGIPTELIYIRGHRPHLLVFVSSGQFMGSAGLWNWIPLPATCS